MIYRILALFFLLGAASAQRISSIHGVDCSGHNDSSAVLNAYFQHISNQRIIWDCEIRADTQILIQGQESFSIEGDGDRPNIPGGPSLFGCNGTVGALLRINRSGFWTIRGFGIFPKGINAICQTSNFTRSLDIDNSGNDGFTTTHGNIEHMGFTTNVQGGAIPNYVGVNIVGRPNTEHIVLRDNWFHGQNSTNSCGIWVQGFNSDNDLAEGNEISNFFQGICHVGGNMRIVQNNFSANGNFSVFGTGGAAIFITYYVSGPLYIAYNEESDGGPFINSNNDQNGGALRGMNIIGNILGISDIGPNQYPLNIGTGGVPYLVEGNDFYVTGQTSKSVIGSDSQLNCQYGPLGTLIDIANFNSFPSNTGGWSGCVQGKDFQDGHIQIGSNCSNVCTSLSTPSVN